jgi:hypothetical protein
VSIGLVEIIGALRTLTTLVAIALWTGTTVVAVALWTVATLWTLRTLTTTLLGLYIVGRLLDEDTVREFELTSLGVDFEQLDGDLVTLLDASLLDSLETLPVDF